MPLHPHNKEKMPVLTKPTQEERSILDQQIADIEAKKGYKICGARNRELVPCGNKAGKGTDHIGEGRCRNHGGMNQNITAKQYKHGRFSKIKTEHPMLRAKMEQLAGDHDVFDLRDEILKIRAIAEIMAEQEEWLATAKMAVDVSKVIERLHNIEVGRRYVISIENVGVIISAVEEAIFRHVPDEYTRHLIAQELKNTRLSIALPAPKIIDAEYEELDNGEST